MTAVRMDASLRASLEEFLRGLPAAAADDPDINVRDAWRNQIAIEAEGLYLAARLTFVNDLPRAKKAGEKVARRELTKLTKLTDALRNHILNMHRDALEAIEMHQGKARHPLVLEHELRELLAAIARAEKNIPKTPAKLDLHAKHQARETTKYAACMFERLTGKKIKRSPRTVRVNTHLCVAKEDGEFHQFLSEAFKLLCIDAKPAGQIKLMLAEKGREKTPI
jgi:hypothetical protein